jgi:hypothetical protein
MVQRRMHSVPHSAGAKEGMFDEDDDVRNCSVFDGHEIGRAHV